MAKRKIIKIDETKCDGCGLCIPNCPEGALQIIDGKARLISDLFCDGLGACIGHCPKAAIKTEKREAEPYDEKKVMENIIGHGKNTIIAHIKHLKDHGERKLLEQAMDMLKQKDIVISPEDLHEHGGHGHGACPGSKVMDFRTTRKKLDPSLPGPKLVSELKQWPIQIKLVPPFAPYLNGADLLIAADCVPFAYANFHEDLLRGKTLLVGCPKLDDIEYYRQKIGQIVKDNDIRAITYAHMEVPCCSGLVGVIEESIKNSGKAIAFHDVTISITGERLT